jgi:hypothetical protein
VITDHCIFRGHFFVVLAYAVIVLIFLALILRRDLSLIGQLQLKGGWKLAVLVAGLFLLQAGLVLYVPGQTTFQMVILLLSHLALILIMVINYHLAGAKLFALGIALNVIVMVANGGWMPVSPHIYHFVHPERTISIGTRPPSSKNVILPQAETNLWILSDIIPLILPRRRTAISIGDLFLVIGVAQFIFQTTSKKNRPDPGNNQIAEPECHEESFNRRRSTPQSRVAKGGP